MTGDFDDPYDEGGPNPFDPKVLVLYGVARSRMLVVAFALIGASAGLFIGLAKPNTYRSEARLRYTPGLRERFGAEDAAGIGDDLKFRPSPGIGDEIMLLNSQQVFEDVAAELGPGWVLRNPDPTQHDGAGTPFHTRVLHELQRSVIELSGGEQVSPSDRSASAVRAAGALLSARTQLEPIQGSGVILVTHEAHTKEDAQRINQALVRAFIRRHQSYYSVGRHADTERAQSAFESFKNFKDLYREHVEDCGFHDIDEEKTETHARLTQLEQELRNARRNRRVAATRLKNKESELDVMDEFETVTVPGNLEPNPEWKIVKDRILDIEEQLIELERETGSVAELTRRRETLDAQHAKFTQDLGSIERETQAPDSSRKVRNRVYDETRVAIADLKAEDEALGAEIEELGTALEDLAGDIDRMAVCEETHTYFEKEIDVKETAWITMRDNDDLQSGLRELDEQGESNLKAQDPATLPLNKSGPKRMKPLAFGLLGGLLLGIALAVLRQLLDKHVRYPETVEKQLGVPLLTVVPYSRSLRRVQKGIQKHVA